MRYLIELKLGNKKYAHAATTVSEWPSLHRLNLQMYNKPKGLTTCKTMDTSLVFKYVFRENSWSATKVYINLGIPIKSTANHSFLVPFLSNRYFTYFACLFGLYCDYLIRAVVDETILVCAACVFAHFKWPTLVSSKWCNYFSLPYKMRLWYYVSLTFDPSCFVRWF